MKTADRLTSLLVERGPMTVAALAEALDVTPAGVRRHLDALAGAGRVTAHEAPAPAGRGPGRPAQVFRVTDEGRAAAGRQAYDDLAVEALAFLSEHGGPDAVAAFARTRAGSLIGRYTDGSGRSTSPRDLAEALTADGYAATVAELPSGTMVCQHRCPVHRAAAAHPELCEAETEALSQVLGTHVQRLATIAHGDGVCTLHVPRPTPTEGAHP